MSPFWLAAGACGSPAVPQHIELYGFFCEFSSGRLTEVVRDIPVRIAA
jgi:hypothetical protein